MDRSQSYLPDVLPNPPKRVWPLLLALGLVLAMAAWGLMAGKEQEPPMAVWQVSVDGHTFQAEVAATDKQRERGLMGRTQLAQGRGMLFVFQKPRGVGFWMKDTLIPLDILFFDPKGVLLNVALAQPCPPQTTCPNYFSQGEVGYVLELASGEAERLGLEPGDRLSIERP